MRPAIFISAVALATMVATPTAAEERKLGIADVVRAVRAELSAAQTEREARGEDFLFATTELELELSFTVSREAGAEGGVQFWIVEAGASGKLASSEIQKIKLKFETGIDPQKAREERANSAAALLQNSGGGLDSPALGHSQTTMQHGGGVGSMGTISRGFRKPLGEFLYGPPAPDTVN